MIKFRQLKYRNFLSTGNSFTTINLELTKSSLIVGQNGSGKSTMLDALSFALFGKAHRNVNKPQLVNSVNGKDCVVEVEFHALGMEYRILRGLKPAKFEIWQDGVMINQDSHAKDSTIKASIKLLCWVVHLSFLLCSYPQTIVGKLSKTYWTLMCSLK